MMNNEKKPFGEDKLSKLVRLMKRYATELNEDERMVQVSFVGDGHGVLKVVYDDVLNFKSVEQLVEFLEAGQLKRTLMVRG